MSSAVGQFDVLKPFLKVFSSNIPSRLDKMYILISQLLMVLRPYAMLYLECHCILPVRLKNNVQAQKELALSQADVLRVQAMVATLKETSRYHASSFADVDFKLITKLVLQWPVENIFPGIHTPRVLTLLWIVSGLFECRGVSIVTSLLLGENLI